MERHVTERRIMEMQIEHLHEKARDAHAIAREAAKRLMRLGYWMLTHPMRRRLIAVLDVSLISPWREYLEIGFPCEAHSILVSAFRDRAKFRKILLITDLGGNPYAA